MEHTIHVGAIVPDRYTRTGMFMLPPTQLHHLTARFEQKDAVATLYDAMLPCIKRLSYDCENSDSIVFATLVHKPSRTAQGVIRLSKIAESSGLSTFFLCFEPNAVNPFISDERLGKYTDLAISHITVGHETPFHLTCSTDMDFSYRKFPNDDLTENAAPMIGYHMTSEQIDSIKKCGVAGVQSDSILIALFTSEEESTPYVTMFTNVSTRLGIYTNNGYKMSRMQKMITNLCTRLQDFLNKYESEGIRCELGELIFNNAWSQGFLARMIRLTCDHPHAVTIHTELNQSSVSSDYPFVFCAVTDHYINGFLRNTFLELSDHVKMLYTSVDVGDHKVAIALFERTVFLSHAGSDVEWIRLIFSFKPAYRWVSHGTGMNTTIISDHFETPDQYMHTFPENVNNCSSLKDFQNCMAVQCVVYIKFRFPTFPVLKYEMHSRYLLSEFIRVDQIPSMMGVFRQLYSEALFRLGSTILLSQYHGAGSGLKRIEYNVYRFKDAVGSCISAFDIASFLMDEKSTPTTLLYPRRMPYSDSSEKGSRLILPFNAHDTRYVIACIRADMLSEMCYVLNECVMNVAHPDILHYMAERYETYTPKGTLCTMNFSETFINYLLDHLSQTHLMFTMNHRCVLQKRKLCDAWLDVCFSNLTDCITPLDILNIIVPDQPFGLNLEINATECVTAEDKSFEQSIVSINSACVTSHEVDHYVAHYVNQLQKSHMQKFEGLTLKLKVSRTFKSSSYVQWRQFKNFINDMRRS